MKINATEKELIDLISQGLGLPEIQKRTGVTMKYLMRVFIIYIGENRQPRLGNKTEPYYPNEESMNIPTYTYYDLSEEERNIYNELSDKRVGEFNP